MNKVAQQKHQRIEQLQRAVDRVHDLMSMALACFRDRKDDAALEGRAACRYGLAELETLRERLEAEREAGA